ncbi:MAG: hypothetical protein QOG23_1955 [Blastocatellia bacterium]|jgi:hypothetical protein|nr:hypothetical protein [Blastocatellia bacterium]
MGYRSTILKPQRDGEFLAEHRRDPVTGRVFTTGNRVTLCGACLLPFLEESWLGIGGRHCGQSSSLGIESQHSSAEAPIKTEIDFDDNTNRENGEVSDAGTNNDLLTIPISLRQIPITLG